MPEDAIMKKLQVELGKLNFSSSMSFFSVNIPGAWWWIRQICQIHPVLIYSNKCDSCGLSTKTVFYSQKSFIFIWKINIAGLCHTTLVKISWFHYCKCHPFIHLHGNALDWLQCNMINGCEFSFINVLSQEKKKKE